MTEAEWLACEDVEKMLEWVSWGMNVPRKWRLFALACIEPIRSHIHLRESIAALAVIAREAEGQCQPDELSHAFDAAGAALDSIVSDPSEQRWYYVSEAAARAVVFATYHSYGECTARVADRCAEVRRLCANPGHEEAARRQANRWHAALLRDIFGNPFRPVALDPLWLTFDVQALARGTYDETAFDRMPILADALQDAGCDNPDVLNHCRDTTQVHARGCWVVDLLLGKG